MPRLQIPVPEHFPFQCSLPVRITDLNYGGHVGNDRFAAFMQEARIAFLASLGYSELEIEGTSLIMGDCQISFKAELFYGDLLTIRVYVAELHKYGFNLFYQIENQNGTVAAVCSSNMLCFNYKTRKLVPLPSQANEVLKNL